MLASDAQRGIPVDIVGIDDAWKPIAMILADGRAGVVARRESRYKRRR
jgi:hypothetical protein